jgi:hypothetical protein
MCYRLLTSYHLTKGGVQIRFRFSAHVWKLHILCGYSIWFKDFAGWLARSARLPARRSRAYPWIEGEMGQLLSRGWASGYHPSTLGSRSNPRVLSPAPTPPVLAIFPTVGAATARRMAKSPLAVNTSKYLPLPKCNTGSAFCNFCNVCNRFVTVL